jgi:hypothetical protein
MIDVLADSLELFFESCVEIFELVYMYIKYEL